MSPRGTVKGNINPVSHASLSGSTSPRVDGKMMWRGRKQCWLKREGYGLLDVVSDAWEALTSPGLRHLAWTNLASVASCATYILPWYANCNDTSRATAADARRGLSVRAQVLDVNGSLVDDFIFHTALKAADGKAILLHGNALALRRHPLPSTM